MKRTILVMLKILGIAAMVSFGAGLLFGGRSAQAFPGSMCFDSGGCGKCEVCVKDKPLDPAGKCHQIAGCY